MLMAQQATETNWTYKPDEQAEPANQTASENPAGSQLSISWTASEFIDRYKGAGWYTTFITGIILFSAAIFLFTKDYMSSAVIILAGLIFIMVSRKKPQQLLYEVNEQGIQIGPKFYQYGMFKSFDLTQDGAIKSIDLIPLKRLMPEVTVYFPPEQEMAIVNLLATHLPHNPQPERTVDKLAKKLRF